MLQRHVGFIVVGAKRLSFDFLNIKLTLIDFKLIKLIKAATYHGPTELAGFHYFPESKKQQECNQFPLLFSVAATNSAARAREGKCETETGNKNTTYMMTINMIYDYF